MSIETLDFAEPFFTVKRLLDEPDVRIGEKCIIVNLSARPIEVEGQRLGFFQRSDKLWA